MLFSVNIYALVKYRVVCRVKADADVDRECADRSVLSDLLYIFFRQVGPFGYFCNYFLVIVCKSQLI